MQTKPNASGAADVYGTQDDLKTALNLLSAVCAYRSTPVIIRGAAELLLKRCNYNGEQNEDCKVTGISTSGA